MTAETEKTSEESKEGRTLIVPDLFVIVFGAIMLFLILGATSATFAGTQTDIHLQEIAGEGYVRSNGEGFADVWEYDLYTKNGEYVGRYHVDEPYWYFFNEQGAYDNIKIIKLEERDCNIPPRPVSPVVGGEL